MDVRDGVRTAGTDSEDHKKRSVLQPMVSSNTDTAIKHPVAQTPPPKKRDGSLGNLKCDLDLTPNISPHTLPNSLPKITCANECVGFEAEMNAVPIEREIVYLKRKNGIYTLYTKTVIVGCTCVYPKVIERND
uniref:Uncharacterized protein n=1 Tax=Leptobrachium leishanense TaxID=445787 RepID=A0A8C5MTI7_9ANUR